MDSDERFSGVFTRLNADNAPRIDVGFQSVAHHAHEPDVACQIIEEGFCGRQPHTSSFKEKLLWFGIVPDQVPEILRDKHIDETPVPFWKNQSRYGPYAFVFNFDILLAEYKNYAGEDTISFLGLGTKIYIHEYCHMILVIPRSRVPSDCKFKEVNDESICSPLQLNGIHGSFFQQNFPQNIITASNIRTKEIFERIATVAKILLFTNANQPDLLN